MVVKEPVTIFAGCATEPNTIGSMARAARTPQHPSKPLQEAEGVGRRLASEFHAVFRAMGWPERSTRSIAMDIGVSLNVCHSAVAASKCASNPLQAIKKTPGVEGITAIRQAAAHNGVHPHLLEALDAATKQLETLIERHGGSLIRLRALLDKADPRERVWKERLAERKAIFRGNAAYLGCKTDAIISSTFLRETPGHKGATLDGVTISSCIGIQARPGGMPVIFASFIPGETESNQTLTPSPSFARSARLLPQYCSEKLPLLSHQRSESGQLVQVMDTGLVPSNPHEDPSYDISFATPVHEFEHPFRTGNPDLDIARCRYPTRELVHEVYLPRALAERCVPSAGAYWTGKWTYDGESGPWHDRIPGAYNISTIPGENIDNPSKFCHWYLDMIREVSAQYGCSVDDAVCFRHVVPFPLWGASYVISLEPSEPANDEDPQD